ncbi:MULTISPECIES: Type 1 glutamine amidotransferase-like domain-containing protein [unclassified Fusibacter]|uniref:Type 1 glutamine amidotransferase-like domain-containing protein n=1 Tax=unclassified Fusibacter TaxID=2624464 RepID=UPI0013E914DC|nr:MULTISPECIES: Type 1 glutamine amidotransferase-like domain-containing protein [unclassified Fusibacter]MCK8059596.1 peptidase E [Fusibacter sp. A2]NPE21397.1 type 1 glutamine amidotransferase-like domain-containing protein [Fusibacter sp. A1]
MINILHNTFNIDEDWCFKAYRNYIKAGDKVVIVAFSFREERVRNQEDWLSCYGRANGKYYSGMVDAFKRYSIAESDITWVNYFEDSVEESQRKISEADIVYFPGGLPDKMMERLYEKELVDLIKRHDGLVMGFSAGALIQLSEYHLTADEDYDEFCYHKGLSLVQDFYFEVHYEGSQEQNESILRVLLEKKKDVYAVGDKGALILADKQVQLVGDVRYFSQKVPGTI